MTAPNPIPPSRLPMVLFGVMTVMCFGGPFGLMWILRGGTEPAWPPDRPVEWVALIGMSAIVATLMVILLVMNLRLNASIKAAKNARDAK